MDGLDASLLMAQAALGVKNKSIGEAVRRAAAARSAAAATSAFSSVDNGVREAPNQHSLNSRVNDHQHTGKWMVEQDNTLHGPTDCHTCPWDWEGCCTDCMHAITHTAV